MNFPFSGLVLELALSQSESFHHRQTRGLPEADDRPGLQENLLQLLLRRLVRDVPDCNEKCQQCCTHVNYEAVSQCKGGSVEAVNWTGRKEGADQEQTHAYKTVYNLSSKCYEPSRGRN